MKTKTIELYDFNELNESTKEKIRNEYNEHQREIYNDEFLEEEFYHIIKKSGFENIDNIEWSLNYCQGDGVCFTATYKNEMTISYNYASRYTHKYSHYIEIDDIIPQERQEELKQHYYDTCDKLESYGYNALYYDYDDNEINEYYQECNVMFDKYGREYNTEEC